MEVEPTNDSAPAPPPDLPFSFSLDKALSLEKGPISCVKYSPDGQFLAVSTAGMTVQIFNTSDYSTKYVFSEHNLGVNAVAWSPCSRYIASCSDDKTICVWSVEKGNLVRIITGLQHFPTCIAINPRGTILACSCSDYHIYFFSLFTRELLKSCYAHADLITSIHFNSDGSRLVSSSVDGYCRIWDCESGNCISTYHPLKTSTPIINAVFSPNDQYVLLSYPGKGLALWCLEHDVVEKVASGHHVIDNYLCNSLFYSYGFTALLTGSENGKVVLYAIEGDDYLELPCCNDVVLSVDYSTRSGDIAIGTMGEGNQVIILKRGN